MKQLITPVKDSRFATPVKAGLWGPSPWACEYSSSMPNDIPKILKDELKQTCALTASTHSLLTTGLKLERLTKASTRTITAHKGAMR